MKLYGIIGYPLQHSFSPKLMNSFFREEGIDAAYGCFAVKPLFLRRSVEALRALGFSGANVTIPHKETMAKIADRLSPEAREMGAVNTLKIERGRIEGFNTDGFGFIRSLEQRGVKVSNVSGLILGAGGAARAVAFALLSKGAARVSIAARSPSTTARLVRQLRERFRRRQIGALALRSGEIAKALPEVSLIVNATPIGMGKLSRAAPPVPMNQIGRRHFVADLIYNPNETVLLARARRRGAGTLNGLPMLIYQAAKNLDIWFGPGTGERAVRFWNAAGFFKRDGRHSRSG